MQDLESGVIWIFERVGVSFKKCNVLYVLRNKVICSQFVMSSQETLRSRNLFKFDPHDLIPNQSKSNQGAL